MRRRTLVGGAAAAAVVVSGATAAVVGLSGQQPSEAAQSDLPAETAEITKTTLRDTVTVEGTLGYGDVVPVNAGGKGTVTWLAPVGSTVKRGKPLFKVDQQPVVALYGTLPLYRELRTDVEGDDVKQLERNLQKLGYTGFTVDEYFTDDTADAVAEWQDDLGLESTGVVKAGELVFVPSAVRVAEHSSRVGAPANGQVLSYTGTAREVTVEAEVADQRLVKVGAKVSVAVPGGETVSGKVSEVGTVASGTDDESSEAPGGSDDGSSTEDATLEVIVQIPEQEKLGDLDGGPVDVTFTSGTRKGVLAVPVAALLGLAEGGYGVEVVDGSKTRVVAVDTGLFADGLVEISGDGIEAGMTVGVAS